MWEEDPRWEEAKYRFVLCGVAALGALSLFSSFLTGDWSYLGLFCFGLGIILGALCLYAAVVRGVALLIELSIRVYRRFH